MKKLIIAGTAAAGLLALSHPAQADLKLDLEGYFRGYAVYTDNDELHGAGDPQLAKFSFLRDSEVHFTGQTTLDNGLTVGVHDEIALGNTSVPSGTTTVFGAQKTDNLFQPGDDPQSTNEVYAYFQGEWGRINLGSEDGAAYLLQVAAPSADSNIDGLRVYIQGFESADTWAGFKADDSVINIPLGYDNADFRQSERLTYLTPKWSGFQAGVSYAAVPGMQNPYGGTFGQPSITNNNQFKDLWEGAGRWDGAFSGIGIGISIGGGFAGASTQSANPTGDQVSKNLQTWDGGINLTWQQFSLGAAYKWSNTGVAPKPGNNADSTIWDGGIGWDQGPWHAGVSYFHALWGNDAYGDLWAGLPAGSNLTVQRETIGGGYTFGPGMSLRGSVALLQADNEDAVRPSPNQTQVAIGTDIKF